MKVDIQIKRAYDEAASTDGFRVLIDRLWPRGLSKDEFKFDAWCKELAPSPDLRKWFGHKVGNWEKFRADYRHELQDAEQRQRMTKLVQDAAGKRLTLLYAAKDENHNHALVLAEEIDRAIKKGQ